MSLAFADKDTLRRQVPVAVVATKLGLRVTEQDTCLCPFHDDSSPSLNFYTDSSGIHRWGCFPCGLGGDAFDLVRRVKGVVLGDAMRFVAEAGANLPPPPPPPERVIDREALEAYVLSSQRNAAESNGYLCVAASLSENPQHVYDIILKDVLHWGVDDRLNVVMPHYGMYGKLTGAKIRAQDGQKWSFPGSKFDSLYGDWFAVTSSQVVICEGETDTAHTKYDYPVIDVRSLPSGAPGNRRHLDAWVDSVLHYETIYLGFDNDFAGRGATEQWRSALSVTGKPTYLLQIPEGEDIRSCGIPVKDLIRGAKRVV